MKGLVDSSPSKRNNILCFYPPPAKIPDANFSMSRKTQVTFYAFWEAAEDDEANLRWVAEGARRLAPKVVGYWLNETDLTADPSRARKSFAPENWVKARKIRAQHDPNNRFVDYILLEDA